MPSVPFSVIGQVIYGVSMLAAFVAALWIALQRHRYCRIVLPYGLVWASPILLAEVLFLGFCWMAWDKEGFRDLDISIDRDTILLESIPSVLGKFVGSVVFIVSGMYLAVRSGRSGMPLLRGFERRWKNPGVTVSTPIGRALAEAAGVAAVCLSYTLLIFTIAQPVGSEEFRKLVRAIGEGEATNLPLLVKGLVSAPLFEEIVFRHFLQRALGMHLGRDVQGRALAVFLSSLVWSLGHAGMVTPEWSKMAQTLGIGLALGWLYERRGLEASVLAHFLFNGVSAILMTDFK